MDAMSHLGVAKDVCAYLSHHQQKEVKPVLPYTNNFKADNTNLPIQVTIENAALCPRYSGVSISNITVQASPDWLQNKLKAIGLRPINNIVDITNFILHETGQPLHAFDADAISGNHIVVKTLPEGTPFITLDGKERKLADTNLMICNEEKGMCIAGVFGGAESGVKESTKNIFLESATFSSTSIRKTSVGQNLRTDAASRFEKGTDISATVMVLQRAAALIKDIAGGEISSEIVDVYPNPQPKTEVTLSYSYLLKLSGKKYASQTVKNILVNLGFEILSEVDESITVAVPYSKPDIRLGADLVEEIIRIDGLDNIEIPTTISMSPAKETLGYKEALKEKISQQLSGLGFYEIVTNSITNSKYFSEEVLSESVQMINNLSADLDVLRPSMLQTGIETIVYNLNRKNTNLRFYEWGKTYHKKEAGRYKEREHLGLYITGNNHDEYWNAKSEAQNIFTLKGYVQAIAAMANINGVQFEVLEGAEQNIGVIVNKQVLATLTAVSNTELRKFDCKQPVFFADIYLDTLLSLSQKTKITYSEISKFPAVQRDLAMVVAKSVTYADIQNAVNKQKISRLTDVRLFDIFESEKLGKDKKSMAINFTFTDDEKTLTDKEIDSMMNRIMQSLQKELEAEIRK